MHTRASGNFASWLRNLSSACTLLALIFDESVALRCGAHGDPETCCGSNYSISPAVASDGSKEQLPVVWNPSHVPRNTVYICCRSRDCQISRDQSDSRVVSDSECECISILTTIPCLQVVGVKSLVPALQIFSYCTLTTVFL